MRGSTPLISTCSDAFVAGGIRALFNYGYSACAGLNQVVHTIGGVSLHLLGHVSIAVHSERNSCMTEIAGYRLDVRPVLYCQRCIRMAQVMKASCRLANTCGNALEVRIQRVVLYVFSIRIRKYKPFIVMILR